MAKCKGTRKDGEKCGGTRINNTHEGLLNPDFCMGHQSKEAKQKLRFGGAQEGAGAPRKPRAMEMLKERLEERADEVLAPFFDGLSAMKQEGTIQDPDSDDPKARIPKMVPDLYARQQAARELLDRGYGRPTQMTEVSGPNGGPIPTAGISIPENADEGELHSIADALAKRRAA